MVRNPSTTDAGILNNTGHQCQVLEAPELQIVDRIDDIPEVQESTMQVPCGQHSIFDLESHELSAFDISVYLIVNQRGNWDTGVSHGLSYQEIANALGIKHRAQVGRSLKRLIQAGFLKQIGTRKSDGAIIYQVIHHNCAPEDVPLDKDGRPQKCAVAIGKGSPMQLMAAGKLHWRLMLQWVTQKINSDWISGVAKTVRREFEKLIRFSTQTICDNYKKLCDIGLMQRLSKPHQVSEYQLYPGPYPKRRERAEYKGKRPLPLIGNWYYSYNKRWRFHKETLLLQMEEVDGRWRHASMSELLEINSNIYRDFREYMDAVSAHAMEGIRQLYAEFAAAKQTS